MIADHEWVTDDASMGDGRDEKKDGGDAEERCSYCRTEIDVTSWHPLLSRVENSDVELYPFCSVKCRDAWLDE